MATTAQSTGTILEIKGVVIDARFPDGDLPRKRWVSVHVDTEDDPDPEADLAWFATQEIPDLLDGRSGR